jgi:S-DNA-T family DNA segregation ATPase FtsK/SpoIIIE
MKDYTLAVSRWLFGYRWELAPLLAAWLAFGVASESLPMWLAIPIALGAGGLPAWRWWNPTAYRRHTLARRAARFARSFPSLCEKLGLTRVYTNRYGIAEIEAPSVKSWELMPGGGFRLHLRCPIGVTPSDFEANEEALAGALGGSSIEVKRNTKHAGDVYLTLVGQDDPLFGEARSPVELLGLPGGHSPLDGVPIGYNSSGETVRVSLYQKSLLVGGSPGSGKSVLMQQLVAFAALADSCELWCIDPKLVELRTFWRGSAHRMATDVESATALLDELIEVMNARYEALDVQRKQKVFEPAEGRYPTDEMPLIVLVVDEVAELTASLDKKEGTAFAERLRLIVAKGRAAGITPVLCTQKPDSSVIPTSIRDLCSTRIALRCGTEAQAITILGDSAVKNNGANAHMIGTDTPGLAYLTGEEGAQVTRLRSFFISGEDMETLPARALRHKLTASTPPLSDPLPLPTTAERLAGWAGYDPSQILPPRVESPVPFVPRDYLADKHSPTVVFGCEEHRGKSGIDALEAAHACPNCMELPRGKDGD